MTNETFTTLKDEFLKIYALSLYDDKYATRKKELEQRLYQYLLFKPFQLMGECFCLIQLSTHEFTYYRVHENSIQTESLNYHEHYLFKGILLNEIHFITKPEFIEAMMAVCTQITDKLLKEI